MERNTNPGTLFCVLCQGIVTYRNGDTKRFNDHMNIDHGAHHNLRYILAGSLMSKEERNIVAEIIEERNGNVDSKVAEKNVTNGGLSETVMDKAPLADDRNILSLDDANGDNREKPFKCHLCDFRCTKRKYLTKHLARFHKISNEECSNTRNDSDRNDLSMSMTTDSFPMSTTDSFSMSICKEQEVDEVETNKDNKCNFCNKTFYDYWNVIRHQRTVHKNEVVSGEENTNDLSPPKAAIVDYVSESKKHKCDVCDSGFSSFSSLRRHRRRVHKIKNEGTESTDTSITEKSDFDGVKNKCKICGTSFSRADSLERHLVVIHKSIAIGKSEVNLTGVKKTSTEVKKSLLAEIFKCEHCDFTSTKRDRLKFHKTMKHKPKKNIDDKLVVARSLFIKKSTEDDNFKCGKCDFSCNNAKELRYHRFRNHRHYFIKRNMSTMLEPDDENSLASKKEIDEELVSIPENQVNVQEAQLENGPVNEENVVQEPNLGNRLTFQELNLENVPQNPENVRELNSENVPENLVNVQKLNLENVTENQTNNQELCLESPESQETDQELLLSENPEDSDADVSLEFLETSFEEGGDPLDINDSSHIRNERLKVYNEKKKDIIEKSDYFKTHPNNITSWIGLEEELLPVENLPPGWGLKTSMRSGGRKYGEYVTPDRMFRLRSLVSALEYIKCSGQD